MQKIRPFLWFDKEAEEAANLYVSIFKNSRVTDVTRYGASGPGPASSVMTVAFVLDGQEFIALNGGPHFRFTEAVSMFVTCEDQAEVDYFWDKLIEGGGQPSRCGWLKDRFGLSWQIVPAADAAARQRPREIGTRHAGHAANGEARHRRSAARACIPAKAGIHLSAAGRLNRGSRPSPGRQMYLFRKIQQEQMMQLNPYLSFDGHCEEAFKFYAEVLGGEILATMTYGETPMVDQTPAEWRGRIAHMRMTVGGTLLMGSDSPPDRFEPMKGITIALNIDEPVEAERVFHALAPGGTVTMPIQETFWARRFGMLTDRFGTPWMINCEKPM